MCYEGMYDERMDGLARGEKKEIAPEQVNPVPVDKRPTIELGPFPECPTCIHQSEENCPCEVVEVIHVRGLPDIAETLEQNPQFHIRMTMEVNIYGSSND